MSNRYPFLIFSLLMGILNMTLSFPSHALADVDDALKIKSVRVQDITNDPSFAYLNETAVPNSQNSNRSELDADCKASGRRLHIRRGAGNFSSELPSSLDPIEAWVDQIINIGSKIYKVIDAGRPVVNAKFDVSHALPKGVDCWMDLAEWNRPSSHTYRVTYTNFLGFNAVDFIFKINFISGGNANGIGKYLTYVTVIPAVLDVSWGYTVNVDAKTPVVYNRGTNKSPLAGMELQVHWTVDSVFSHNEQTRTYYIDGNNTFEPL